MNKLLRFDDDQLYLIFDVETCNVNLLQDNYIWQLGFLVANNKEILEKHNYYIYWDDILNKISEGAKIHTKFNYEIYKKNARPQEEIIDIFEKYLYDDKYLKVGHNIFHFDIFVHNQWRRVNNRKTNYSYLNNALDTDAIARAWKIGVKGIQKNEWFQSMFRYGNYKEKGMKTNLTALGKEFKIDVDYDKLHDGLNDCVLDYYVFKQLMYKMDI